MDLDEEVAEEEDEEEEDEEDEWNGIRDSGADASISGPSGGGGKPKKPPTGEEVRAIKEATDLYKSNTFKLRVSSTPYFLVGICPCAECLDLYHKMEHGMTNHFLPRATPWSLRDAKPPLGSFALLHVRGGPQSQMGSPSIVILCICPSVLYHPKGVYPTHDHDILAFVRKPMFFTSFSALPPQTYLDIILGHFRSMPSSLPFARNNPEQHLSNASSSSSTPSSPLFLPSPLNSHTKQLAPSPHPRPPPHLPLRRKIPKANQNQKPENLPSREMQHTLLRLSPLLYHSPCPCHQQTQRTNLCLNLRQILFSRALGRRRQE